VAAFDVLAKALKATALVVLLSFAWALPANAHAGHGAASKAVAPAVKTLPQEARQSPASLAAEPAGLCDPAANGAPAPTGCPPDEGAQGRSCCGTICTVAAIEHDVVSLPLRTPHSIRIDMAPERASPVREPGLQARPPRTIDIA